jgi:hypothetical protein
MKEREMRRSEEAMDKVLAGLREAEAPAGMEQRILEALERRPLAQPAARWWAMTPVWGLAAACLVCGVVLGAVAVTWMTPRIREVHESRAVPALSKSLSAPAVGTPRVDSDTVEKSARASQEEPNVRVATGASPRKAVVADSEAVEEMRAASRPAPPMPLTEQEKMLVLLVKKDGASEAKELDPAARAKKDADEMAEFQNFFEPPKTGDKE